MAREAGVFLRPAEAGRIGHRLAEALLRFRRQGEHHRRAEQARRNGADADAELGELARQRQGHAMHGSLGGAIGWLAAPAIEGGERGGVDDVIGREACRERVGPYGYTYVAAAAYKKKNQSIK